jgi:hypothetical protein
MCISFLLLALTATAANLPAVPYLESDTYLVRLTQWERTGKNYDEYKFVFHSKDKKSGRESTQVLQNETTDLQSAYIVKHSLVVFGEIRDTADVMTLFDLDTGEVRDHFLCYGPQLSDSKKYLIYRKFYPRAAELPATSDLILIYDLDSPPEGNRVKTDGQSADNIGIPIFPEENVKNHSLQVWVEKAEERDTVYPPNQYLWLNHDAEVTFVDKRGGENWIVLVDLSHGVNQALIRKNKIDLTTTLGLDRASPEYPSKLKQYNKSFMVSQIEAGGHGEAILRIGGIGPHITNEIAVALP